MSIFLEVLFHSHIVIFNTNIMLIIITLVGAEKNCNYCVTFDISAFS